MRAKPDDSGVLPIGAIDVAEKAANYSLNRTQTRYAGSRRLAQALDAMGKLKVLVTGVLFLASCVALLGTQGAVAAIQNSYTSAFPSSFGGHLPAFTASAMQLMPNIPAVCFTAVVVSILLTALVLWRARSREAKLYWVTVLGSVNFYVCVFLSGVVLVGFFLLPRVAHGI